MPVQIWAISFLESLVFFLFGNFHVIDLSEKRLPLPKNYSEKLDSELCKALFFQVNLSQNACEVQLFNADLWVITMIPRLHRGENYLFAVNLSANAFFIQSRKKKNFHNRLKSAKG